MNTRALHTQRRAFLLVETLLACAISGVLALGALIMVISIGVAVEQGSVIQSSAMTEQTFYHTLSCDIRCAQSVIAAEPDAMIFWMGDVNGDKAASIAECIVYRYDSDSNTLTRFAPQSDLGEVDDLAIPADTDIVAFIMPHLGDLFVAEKLASDLASFSIAAEISDDGRVASVRATIESPGTLLAADLSTATRIESTTDAYDTPAP